MKCPHCLQGFHDSWNDFFITGSSKTDYFKMSWTHCPECRDFIVYLAWSGDRRLMVYPRGISRSPLSPDIPVRFSQDYNEACLVLSDSAKASAALSRRCLQALLREQAKVAPSDLSKEIDAVLASHQLPTHLAEAIDAVRNIGNFAAHPVKSTSTGDIVEVEPGEAEWLLDVLEGLFDYYFVLPASLRKKKEALNEKLSDAGKPPMK